jgi:preprotein translocase subunit SecG
MFMNIMWGLQTLIAVVLIALVLIQNKGQGFSMSMGAVSSAYRSRRGAEKLVFNATIIFGVLFGLNSLVMVILSQ